jgi:hypothetical protein
MTSALHFAQCPATLWQGEGEQAVSWQQDPDFAARPDEEIAELFHLVPIDVAVDSCRPVYRQHPGTAPAVATGRLFLRLYDDRTIDSFDAALEALGLCVAVLLKWAPNAAWVTAIDDRPCHALSQLSELQKREGVTHAEAQLLMAVQHR